MHRLKSLLVAALILQFGNIAAQEATYTDAQKQKFTQIYWELKEYDSPEPELDTTISIERYQEIFSGLSRGDDIKLTPDEQGQLNKLRELKSAHDAKINQVSKALCEQYQLPLEVFNGIQEQYRSDLAFQRELQSYFENYFKSRL